MINLIKVSNISNINPLYSNSKILHITSYRNFDDSKFEIYPSFWLIFDNKIYYGICNYAFELLEGYDDWDDFKLYNPKEKEFNLLMSHNPIFYLLNYKEHIIEASENELDYFSEYELEILKKENRNNHINNLDIQEFNSNFDKILSSLTTEEVKEWLKKDRKNE